MEYANGLVNRRLPAGRVFVSSALWQARDDAGHLLFAKGAQRLRFDVTLLANGYEQRHGSLLVGQLDDADAVVLACKTECCWRGKVHIRCHIEN